MSTSVKLNESDKRKLEKLQALVTMKTSKRVTQQEILSKVISEASELGEKFVHRAFEDSVPMSDESYRKMLSLVDNWKIKTKWEDIDETLYGSTVDESKVKRKEHTPKRNQRNETSKR